MYTCKPQFYYIQVGLKGVKLYRNVFVMKSILLLVNICEIAGYVANSVDPYQTPRCAASDLGLHSLLRPVLPNM